MEFGTIKFERKNGDEIWKITSSDFSISPNGDKFKVNIWVESYFEVIKKLNDTGDTGPGIEVVFTIEKIPNFSKKFHFKMPEYDEVSDNWDEDKGYFLNWYYYDHRDIDNLEIEIISISEEKFSIKMIGMGQDPLSGGEFDTKVTIEFESSLNQELNGFWAH